MSEQILNLILDELRLVKTDVTSLKQAVLENSQKLDRLDQVKQATLETQQDMKQMQKLQKSLTEIVGDHEVSIRTMLKGTV